MLFLIESRIREVVFLFDARYIVFFMHNMMLYDLMCGVFCKMVNFGPINPKFGTVSGVLGKYGSDWAIALTLKWLHYQ